MHPTTLEPKKKKCMVPDCDREATPHHLIYNEYLYSDDVAFVLPFCEWHHKLITKTAFLKTMESIFDTNWANYKGYLKQKKESANLSKTLK